MTTTERIHDAIFASFIADALALGAHWEYDQQRIAANVGRMDTFRTPTLTGYHKTKTAGDQSHYGDQMYLLTQSVTENSGFSLPRFAELWQRHMSVYEGYIDKATRETLKNLHDGVPPDACGALSNDFSAAARIAPLLLNHAENLTELVDAARQQALFTHKNKLVADGAEFFARATYTILQGSSVREAFDIAADAPYQHLPAEDWLAFTYMAAGEDPLIAIERFGQSCGMKSAFHGVIHFTVKYEEDPQEGIIQNVMAGGDSCARGLMLGLLLGARHGAPAFAPQWKADLRIAQSLQQLLTA